MPPLHPHGPLYGAPGPPPGDGGVFQKKVPILNEWVEENPMTHIVPSLAPRDGETVMHGFRTVVIRDC
eukprot:gene29977-63434_t